MPITRKKTKKIHVGTIAVGGDAPVSIQTMTNTKTTDIEATLAQIALVERLGCDIVRISTPDIESVEAFGEIKKRTSIPLVADIHFDYRLAISAAEKGADCLRINPGNIGNTQKIKEVISSAIHHNIPIRIGVNSGSLEREILEKYHEPSPNALLESALKNISLLENNGFQNYKVSIKSSDVLTMIECYERLSSETDNPLHLGLTEAGTIGAGGAKSSIALGHLLYQGIGDTIRISLAADPAEEVKMGINVLKALGLNNKGLNLVACPGCARQNFDMTKIGNLVEAAFENQLDPIKVSIIGCIVNGIGEAKESDIGITGGKDGHLIYLGGKKYKKIPTSSEEEIAATILSLAQQKIFS